MLHAALHRKGNPSDHLYGSLKLTPQCGHASQSSVVWRVSIDQRPSFAMRSFLKSVPQRGQRNRLRTSSHPARNSTMPPIIANPFRLAAGRFGAKSVTPTHHATATSITVR